MMARTISSLSVELYNSSVETDHNKVATVRAVLDAQNGIPNSGVLSVYNGCVHNGKVVRIAFWDDFDLDTVYLLE